jgi:hypothetical protein
MKLFDDVTRFLINIKRPLTDERREILEIEAKDFKEEEKNLNTIICNGVAYGIEWEKVKKHTEVDAFSLPNNCYKTVKNDRKPTMFVTHWDVCLSSQSCFNVLKKRKLSVHFLIDNDGTIHQIMDTNHIAYHAGNRRVNNNSIGVEITNAFYLKYQNIYEKRGFGPRPICDDSVVHGNKLETHLGFYDVQLQALEALMKSLNKAYDIPLETPTKDDKPIQTIVPEVYTGKYKGFVNHFHITKRKIDCANLNLKELINKILD